MNHFRSPLRNALSAIVSFSALLALAMTTSSANAEEPAVLDKMMDAASKTCSGTSSFSTLGCKLAVAVAQCRMGDANGCELVGRTNLSLAIHDVPKGHAAHTFLLRACVLSADRCIGFARLSMARLGDPALAQTFLETGCSRSADVCKSAAAMYVEGRAVPADATLARRFMQRACDAKDASACAAVQRP